MRSLLQLLLLIFASSASALSIDWVPIGNPGNPGDPHESCGGCGPGTTFGSVPYEYLISKYEITNAQYAEYLNEIAQGSDRFRYVGGAEIEWAGTPGSYVYTPIAGRENVPVYELDFYKALRFANWLNSGDPESGSYTLLGGTPSLVARNPGAGIFIPTENEWYKAAYFDPSSASYFDYPAGSDTPMTCSGATSTPNHAACDLVAPPPDGGPVDVGSYSGSPSPYGTYDQAGNVMEWNETVRPSSIYYIGVVRGVRGEGWVQNGDGVGSAASRWFEDPTYGGGHLGGIGFRVVRVVPEPSTGLLVVLGLAAMVRRARPR